MADLSFLNDTANTVGDAIDALLAARQKQRNYLGLSQVGIVNECPRKAWYIMKGYAGKPFEGRILRLFRSGDDIEFNMVTDLKDIGLNVWGAQKEVKATQDGESFVGHIDGMISGLENLSLGKKTCLLEVKSCNGKRFKELLKLGDYCKWGGAAYEGQVHIYSTLLKLSRIFVAVENKDTSERWFDRFPCNKDFAIETLQKAFDIKQMESEPERACPRADWYKAKFCNYSDACWRNS